MSPRVLAAQRKNSDRKEVTKEAPALTTEMVKILEGIVLNDAEIPEMRIVIGFILFVLYTRERVADAARVVVEPWCAGPPHPRGHIESITVSENTKHGQSDARRRRQVVLLGPAWGLSQKASWGHKWLQLRKELGRDARKDKTLQLRVDRNWIGVPDTIINANQVTTILRKVLRLQMAPGKPRLSSQGLKATTLLWTGGRGMKPHIQKILGSHANGKEEMKNLYQRQALTWPVNLVCVVIQEMKQKKNPYRPDLRERHLQLSEEAYNQAMGIGKNPKELLEKMQKREEKRSKVREEIDSSLSLTEIQDEETIRAEENERMTSRVAREFMPPLELIQEIGTNTPENDARLVDPVLQVIEQRQAAEQAASEATPGAEGGNSSDSDTPPGSPRENKPESNRESLLNIVAEIEENLPRPKAHMVKGVRVDQHSYLISWTTHVAHLHWEGTAICWTGLDERTVRKKKSLCSKVEDIGTTEICEGVQPERPIRSED